jgi:hypothetical protein
MKIDKSQFSILIGLSQVFAGVFLTPLENSLFIGDLLAFTLFFPFTFEG